MQGDVRDKIKELENHSIDCVVTSPPYWGLRDYGVPGQFGLEPTYQEHIQNIVELFKAIKPKLKDSATIWLNYGDSYAATVNGTKAKDIKNDDRGFVDKPFSTIQGVLKPKDLVMLPNRIAIALQDDGWWIRSEIIWHKPNPMPESIKDRPTSAHEKIWLITKSKKYYYDADAIKEPARWEKWGKQTIIKEQQGSYNITEEELELQFFDQFEREYNNDLEFNPTTLRRLEDALNEDAPTTGTAGIAIRDLPLGKPPKGLVMKRFAGLDVFAIKPALYPKSYRGKKKYDRYSRYVGEDEAGNYIRVYARKYPKKPIIVMDSTTGCMQFLRHGFGK